MAEAKVIYEYVSESNGRTYKVYEDIMHYCPLLKIEIAEAYCYEIASVAAELISPHLIDDNIGNLRDAEKICDGCKHCQL